MNPLLIWSIVKNFGLKYWKQIVIGLAICFVAWQLFHTIPSLRNTIERQKSELVQLKDANDSLSSAISSQNKAVEVLGNLQKDFTKQNRTLQQKLDSQSVQFNQTLQETLNAKVGATCDEQIDWLRKQAKDLK